MFLMILLIAFVVAFLVFKVTLNAQKAREKEVDEAAFFINDLEKFGEHIKVHGYDDPQVVNTMSHLIEHMLIDKGYDMLMTTATHKGGNRYEVDLIKEGEDDKHRDIFVFIENGHFLYKLGEHGKTREWAPPYEEVEEEL